VCTGFHDLFTFLVAIYLKVFCTLRSSCLMAFSVFINIVLGVFFQSIVGA